MDTPGSRTPLPNHAARWPIATALRETLHAGYTTAQLRGDIPAGIVTGIVAVPLSMALSISVGAPPQYGLYTAIVAGSLIALLGGTRTSVSGPTAAFVVILAPILSRYGLAGLCIASLMAGAILVILGVARLGKLIEYVPHPVTTGFTSGIAVVIATLQIKDLFGLTLGQMPEHFLERVSALARAMPTLRWADLSVGLATLAMLLVWPRFTKRVPAALMALGVAAAVSFGLHQAYPDFRPGTINDGRFLYTAATGEQAPGIPRVPPSPVLPWKLPGPGGQPLHVDVDLIRSLMVPAVAIAMLGAIESLLCAVVADGMTGRKHDPDAELIAQGVGNMVAPWFGGFAATAAIARTATGIRAGAQTPFASLTHAMFVLLSMVLLAPLLGYLPMASLAALLLTVAWNMCEARHFMHIVRVAPRSDTVVLLTCFSLTVIFDMVISVTVGVMLSALLFMKRMAEISGTRLAAGPHPRLVAPLPEDVLLYEIGGPLFFGAAEKAAGALVNAHGRARLVILDMDAVPVMDMTGLVALESAIRRLQRAGVWVALASVRPQPRSLLDRAGIKPDPGKLAICRTLEEAEMLARLVLPEHRANSVIPA